MDPFELILLAGAAWWAWSVLGSAASGGAQIFYPASQPDTLPGGWNVMPTAITNDPSTWPSGDRIWEIAHAIAMQEGFNRGPGFAPFDLNNPGDLSPGDENGQATVGAPEFHGGSSIIHFATPEGGFSALYTKIARIVAGGSVVYGQKWTLRQIGAKWAGDRNWPDGVGSLLGINPDREGFYSYVNR